MNKWMNLRIKCNKKTLREEKQELKARLNELKKERELKEEKTERTKGKENCVGVWFRLGWKKVDAFFWRTETNSINQFNCKDEFTKKKFIEKSLVYQNRNLLKWVSFVTIVASIKVTTRHITSTLFQL